MATPKQIERLKKFLKNNWVKGSYTDKELKEMSVPGASKIISKGIEAIKVYEESWCDALEEDPDLGCR